MTHFGGLEVHVDGGAQVVLWVCICSEAELIGVAGVLGSTAYLEVSELGLAQRRRPVGVALGVGLAKSGFV